MNTLSDDNFSAKKLPSFITRQQAQIVQQQERVRILEDEIIRLIKLNLKSDIRPNTKPFDSRGNDGYGDSRGCNGDEVDEIPEPPSRINRPLLGSSLRCAQAVVS